MFKSNWLIHSPFEYNGELFHEYDFIAFSLEKKLYTRFKERGIYNNLDPFSCYENNKRKTYGIQSYNKLKLLGYNWSSLDNNKEEYISFFLKTKVEVCEGYIFSYRGIVINV